MTSQERVLKALKHEEANAYKFVIECVKKYGKY